MDVEEFDEAAVGPRPVTLSGTMLHAVGDPTRSGHRLPIRVRVGVRVRPTQSGPCLDFDDHLDRLRPSLGSLDYQRDLRVKTMVGFGFRWGLGGERECVWLVRFRPNVNTLHCHPPLGMGGWVWG